MNRYCLFFIVFGLSFLCACSNKDSKRIAHALEQAGTNRLELEKVLQHYKDEPKKLKAARFLIANIPYYGTRIGWEIDTLKQLKKESILKGEISEGVIKKWEWFNFHSSSIAPDATTICSELLIENIDLAFHAWESRPWNTYYSFDDFYEYVLPYRIGNEPLERWRSVYYNRYAPVLDSLYQGTDVIEAAKVMAAYLKAEGFVFHTDFTLPHLGALFLLENRVGYCRENCDIAQYVMRSVGIPVATDRYHISPSYRSRHFWNAVIDTTGLSVSFNYSEQEMERGMHGGRQKGKVYRQYFGVQPEVFEGIFTDVHVPASLRNPFLKDVTGEYFPKNKIEVPIENQAGAKFAYLAIFDGDRFEPIDIAKVRKNKAVFQNLQNGLIYQPVFYQEGTSTASASGYPFYLKDSSPLFFIPNTTKCRQVTLKRKYPMLHDMHTFAKALGVRIEGANRKDFKDARLLYQVADTPTINYNKIVLNLKQSYRYIRYTAPQGRRIELAEFAVYADTLAKERLGFLSIYCEQPLSELHQASLKLIVDDDWVSFYMSEASEERLIFDLGEPQYIGSLVFIPRNDDNYIHLGDKYELFYQNGVKGWISLGTQIAKTTFLLYENVPDNALLWLHNSTRGKEERSFYYEGGQQIFP